MLMGMQAFGVKHGAEGPGAILNACSQAGVWDWASWQHLIAFPAMLALVICIVACLVPQGHALLPTSTNLPTVHTGSMVAISLSKLSSAR